MATRWVGVYKMDLLSIRRLVELLADVVILGFEIIIWAKKEEARFVASLVCSGRDGSISQ